MTVDITNLVDNLKAEVNIPGGDAFPAAVDADWEIRLLNAFWETVLDGLIVGYDMNDDGIVTPVTGTTDLNREMQQLVIFYAGISVVRNALRTLSAVFRAKAGPVEFESQNAATVMKSIMDELVRKRNIVLLRLSDVGSAPSHYVDMVIARDESLRYQDSYYVSGSQLSGSYSYSNAYNNW